jgi:hypothetical protein
MLINRIKSVDQNVTGHSRVYYIHTSITLFFRIRKVCMHYIHPKTVVSEFEKTLWIIILYTDCKEFLNHKF